MKSIRATSALATSVVLSALLAAASASAQQGAVEPSRRTPVEAQTQEGPATSLGRQYGTPAGDALATPANPAAAARRDDRTTDPGLDVYPNALGTRSGNVTDGYRIVDEPPMRRLNDLGTGATSAKIGIGERRPDPSVAERLEQADPGMGDESYQVHGFDPAGDPAPPRKADGSLMLPSHSNPSR